VDVEVAAVEDRQAERGVDRRALAESVRAGDTGRLTEDEAEAERTGFGTSRRRRRGGAQQDNRRKTHAPKLPVWLVRGERRARLALFVEARDLRRRVGMRATRRELRADEADHVRAGGGACRDELGAAGLRAVIPELEQGTLARGRIA